MQQTLLLQSVLLSNLSPDPKPKPKYILLSDKSLQDSMGIGSSMLLVGFLAVGRRKLKRLKRRTRDSIVAPVMYYDASVPDEGYALRNKRHVQIEEASQGFSIWSHNGLAVWDAGLAYLLSTTSPSQVPYFPDRSPTSHVSGIVAAHGVLIPRRYLLSVMRIVRGGARIGALTGRSPRQLRSNSCPPAFGRHEGDSLEDGPSA